MAGTSITQKLKMLMEVGLDKKSKMVLKNELAEVLAEATNKLGPSADATFKEIATSVNDAFKKMGKPELSLDIDKLMGDKNKWKSLEHAITHDLFNALDGLSAKGNQVSKDFEDSLGRAITRIIQQLNELIKDLKTIDLTAKDAANGLNTTLKNIGRAVQALNKPINANPFLKSIYDIDEAAGRLGESLGQLNNVFDFGKDIDSIAKLEHQLIDMAQTMNAVDFDNLDWEQQYAIKAQFMSGYRAYENLIQKNSKSRHKIDADLTSKYNEILPSEYDINNMLTNIMNRVAGKKLVGYDDGSNGPWGRDSTLKEIRDILKEGIKVKGDTKSKSGTARGSGNKNNQTAGGDQLPTPPYHAMSRNDATKYIRDNYNYELWEDWYTRSDGDARAKIADILEKDRELRNAALNQMWDDYKHKTNSNIGFDEFLNTPVSMYRGVGKESATTGALSFSLNKETARANAEDAASIIEVLMKPIDTLGMARPLLKPSQEAEVMIMPDKLAQYQSKTIKTPDQLITQADVESANAKCVELETKLNNIENKLKETKKEVAALEKSTQVYRFGAQGGLDKESKIAKSLLAPHNKSNKKYSRSQYIIDQLKAGAVLTNSGKDKYGLERDDNGKKVTSQLTKTEYEYAKFLSEHVEKLNQGWDKGLEQLHEIQSARLRKQKENLEQEQALYDATLAAHQESVDKQTQIQDAYNKQQAKITSKDSKDEKVDVSGLKQMVDKASEKDNIHGQSLVNVDGDAQNTPDNDIDTQLLAIFTELSNKAGQSIAQDQTLQEISAKLDKIKTITRNEKDGDGNVGDINPHYLTDPQGRIVEAYRGVSDVYSGLVSDTGRTWSSTDLDLAERAAGANGKVEKVYLTMKNPLEIDARGSQWDSIEYLGRGETETSEQLLELAQERLEYERQIVEMRKRDASEDEITGVMADLAYTEEMISGLYNDKYGVKTTNEWMDYAKNLGHDGIIIKNVYDDLDHPSDIMGTFEADQLHYIETLPMTFERVINLLKQDLPNVEKYINMSADDIAQTMSQLADINKQFDAGKIGINEYQEFLRNNPMVNDLEGLVNYGQSVFTPIVSEYIVDDRYNDDIIEALTRVQTFINAKKAEFGIHTTPQEAVGQSTVMSDHTPTSQTHDDTLETAPWAKETTVQEIKNILKNGLKIKGGSNKTSTASSTEVSDASEIPAEVTSLIHVLKSSFGIKQSDTHIIQDAVFELFKHSQRFDVKTADEWSLKNNELINTLATQLASIIPVEQTTGKDNPYTEIMSYLKGKVIYVSDAVYNGLDENTQKFVSSSKRFTRKQGKGLPIDSHWDEWSSEHPDFFSSETANASDQIEDLVTLLRAAKAWKPTTGYADQLDNTNLNELQSKIVESLDTAVGKWINNSESETYVKANTKTDEAKSNVGANLIKDYEQLGRLQAQIDNDEHNEVAKEKYRILLDSVKIKEKELGLTEEETELLKKQFTLNAYDNEQSILKARQKQKDYKHEIKVSRDEARINRAGSALNAGRNVMDSFIQIDDDSINMDTVAEADALNSALKALAATRNAINQKGGIVDPNDIKTLRAQTTEVQKQTTAVKELVNNYTQLSGENSEAINGLSFNYGGDLRKQLRDAALAATDGKIKIKSYDDATKSVIGTVKTGVHEFTEYKIAVRDLDGAFVKLTGKTQRAETFFEASKRKLTQISSYFSAMSLINRASQEFRKGIQYIKEIDSALTELRKVTDETEESYDRFIDTAAKTADKVGSTIKDVVSSTADWARLGYSIKEAAELAESTQILMNVSEFTDISSATDSLISAIQAFKYTAEESMDVVDILNTIGNNYAISTADLAQSLTKSSGSLVAANGTLEEAVALTATANTIIQDADVVGTALKTVAMRLRGTSTTEMEEEGLDTDGVVSESKLRGKVKALSGVDILTQAGDYKSTYQILSEIAEVWEDMNDMDQAALLELLAGKRAGSVMSAILQNPETLKDAFESANNAAGSALKENEKYLDSIQGRIDLFTNAVQTMWNNMLDDKVIKIFIDIGTQLVKMVDNVGLLKIAFTALGGFLLKKYNPFGFIDKGADSLENLQAKAEKAKQKYLADPANVKKQQRYEAADGAVSLKQQEIQAETQAIKENTAAKQENIAVEQQAATAETANTQQEVVKTATTQQDTVATKQNTQANVENAQSNQQVAQTEAQATQQKVADTNATQQNTVATKQNTVAGGKFGKTVKGWVPALKNAGKEMLQLGKSMLMMYAITTVFELVNKAFEAIGDAIHENSDSLERAQEKFDELNNELNNTKSELRGLESELDTVKDQIDELLDKGSLSFTDQEELTRLQAQSAELERQISLRETLRASQQQGVNAAAIDSIDKYVNQTSFGSDKTKTERQEEAEENGKLIGSAAGLIIGGVIGALLAPFTAGASLAVGIGVGAGAGALIGGGAGGAIGSAVAGNEYDSEQTVAEAMDSMLETRAKLKEEQDKALTEGDVEAYNAATDALREYDSQMSQHISAIQQAYNAMDWATASEADRQKMIGYADWLDKYSIGMGTQGAKSSAIARIFGDEASGGFAEAKRQIEDINKEIEKAREYGDDLALAEAYEKLENLDFKSILSDEEVARMRELGVYVYEAEDYWKQVVEAESEFIENDLEDVAKDINKITDGLGSLKSAFEEVTEKGILTAKTVVALKEELGIGTQFSDIETVTDAWRDYLDVMMSGVSTTDEMAAATENLAQSIIEAALEKNYLTADNRWNYIAQLEQLGITNAEEYVDDLLQKNMVQDIADSMGPNPSDVRLHALNAAKDNWEKGDILKWSDEQLRQYAEQHGFIDDEITEAHKKSIMDRYGVEEEAIDGIVTKLAEKAQIEKQIDETRAEQKSYNEWKNKYQPLTEDWEEDYLKNFTWSDWDYEYGGLFGEAKYTHKETGKVLTNTEISELYAAATQYNELLQQGQEQGYVINGEIVDPKFNDQINELKSKIQDIDTELDEELTVDVQLELEFQDRNQLVDDIQSIFDTLASAQKEYDDQGYVSVDTMQSLLQLEPKYLDMLVDENGNLNLNKQALHEVAKARITELGIKQQSAILDQALALATNGSSQAILEQISVMETATEVGQDFVEIQMAKIQSILDERVAAGELTEVEADAFIQGTLNQIQAVQTVTQSALDNLHNSLSTSSNTAAAETEDAFKKTMDYWENRIGANQAKYDQIQNEIDLLEKQGKMAGEEYYKEQIALEEQRLQLLDSQKAAAESFLAVHAEGSDEWWEVANTLNDIEGELDDVTLSIQELNDAQAQVHWDIFDKAHDRISDITDQLSTVRDLLSADEDSFFDDEGEWTDKGMAVLGTHIQDIEWYKNALHDVSEELRGLDVGDFDSEQEYYDKFTELTNKQHDYAKAISDSEQSVVDMYESQIDAIEEYTNKLVDSYNDYIDVVKEALDAERDLYDFKKNVQKQTKDIASLERRIASISGSDNAADIAERRKLEAELYEAKEGLSDTYYEHSVDSRQEALDAEAEAYAETLEKYVETLREKLDTATDNMTQFMSDVADAVIANADKIKTEYEGTELTLNKAIIDPWTNAISKMTEFKDKGKSAMEEFAESVKASMEGIYTSIQTNIDNSANKVQGLANNIHTTAENPKNNGAGKQGSGFGVKDGNSMPAADVAKLQYVLNQVFKAGISEDGSYGPATWSAVKKAQGMIGASTDGYYGPATKAKMEEYISSKWQANNNGSSMIGQGIQAMLKKLPTSYYAKGTLGTKRDELAITDESWIGDEITLAAGKRGQLQYLKKGSAVMPADISANLVEWGKLNPNMLNVGGAPNINMINNAVNKPEFNITFDSLVHVDNCSQDTVKDLEKMVDTKINQFSKQMNYAIKKFM